MAFQAALLVHLTQDGRVLGRSHVGGHQPGKGTSQEMSDVFRHMSGILGKAPQKIMAPQNGDEPGSKKQKSGKGNGKSNGKSKGKGPKSHQSNQSQDDSVDQTTVLQLLIRLVLKHDQQLRSMLVDSSFVCFLGQHQQGMLQSLIAETMQWKQDFEACAANCGSMYVRPSRSGCR